jgi:hypothetical protein
MRGRAIRLEEERLDEISSETVLPFEFELRVTLTQGNF